MNKIHIPEFLSPETAAAAVYSSCVNCEGVACQTCQAVSQLSCQNCQGVACQSCQSSCQNYCQGCQSCQSTCENYCQNCQGVACQTCQSVCENSCQNCEGAACQTCQNVCESSCQNCEGAACQTCQDVCENSCQNCEGVACQACQGVCELSCQNCEGVACQSCQGVCELSCQNCEGVACQTCQGVCELSCQNCEGVACQTCQGVCELSCQNCEGVACQTCQGVCELSCQNCEGAACQTCQSACESQLQVADKYSWQFNPVSVGSNGIDTVVRGLWSGFVGGREVLCAACNGYLWELERNADGKWGKTSCGVLDTARDVFMFGFEEKLYILNGSQYKVWDGENFQDVAGYRPLVAVAVPPSGGGTTLEQVNKLTGARRAWFSPDGTSLEFLLPEEGNVDYVKDLSSGEDIGGWTLEGNKVKFGTAPGKGVNSIEIGWTTAENFREQVTAMRCAELYNGVQDTRVFLYGDGSNRALYSGLDYDGKPRADYFPDLNEVAVGDGNTPVTAMLRHYDRLMCFKLDSAWSISYGAMTLPDGAVTAGFYVSPVNRDVGNCAPGQARLVENRPRTLDGRSVMEWRAGIYIAETAGDQSSAYRISQRVDSTIRSFDLTTAKTFYDKLSHEYYVIGENGTALVHNVDADAWYIYTNFAATCLIRYKDELYYGTRDGWLRHCSDDYFSDEGEEIDARWESGSMSFSRDYRRKYSAMVWLGIKPEDCGYLKVTAETDIRSDFAEYSFKTDSAMAVPRMNRIKIKAKKFTYYKLILSNKSADTTATVVSADIRMREAGYVR